MEDNLVSVGNFEIPRVVLGNLQNFRGNYRYVLSKSAYSKW